MIPLGFVYLPFGGGPLWLLAGAFWVWMLVDCIRREPEREVWLWVIILLNLPGAFVYFLVCYVPRLRVSPPRFLGRWFRRRELWQAEAAARNIGNAHQFVELGDILCETGQFDRAAEAYRQALAKDPANTQALWGAASIEIMAKRFDAALELLKRLLDVDPGYKLGEASLAYGRVLLELKELAAAKAHVEQHTRPRTDPEARVLLATIVAEQGDREQARGLLEPLVADLKPARDARSRAARKKATMLLRKLT